jgi:CHAD domain-containing protein
MATEKIEREDKYDAPPDFVLPDLSELVPGDAVEEHTYELVSTYYDTPDDALRRHGITLRHRTGGPDDGWTLKLMAGDARTEVSVESTSSSPPGELNALLLGVRRRQRLVRRAKVSTTRRSRALHDSAGSLVVEVTDDHVHTETLSDEPVVHDWREIEVELGPNGGEAVLSRAGEALTAAGARPSTVASKLARAMGPLSSRPRPDGLAGLVDDYLAAQYEAIVTGDVGLRRDHNLVHPTRVAIRRLRSTLRVFSDLFDPARSDALERELVWYAGLLGAVRDLDVQTKRLMEHLEHLHDDGVAALRTELSATLAAERDSAWHKLRSAMNGKRYLSLLRQLESWRVDPPFTPAADSPPEQVAHFVDRAARALDKRLLRVVKRRTDDELFHDARKAAKRFRYANELAEPALGSDAKRAVEESKDLQTLLGEHQDSVVSTALLTRLGGGGQQGFTYGMLAAQQQQITERIRVAVIQNWLGSS